MLVKTQIALFEALSNKLMFQGELSADYTPDQAPIVVAYNSSEYISLLSNAPGIPHISVQKLEVAGVSGGIDRVGMWGRSLPFWEFLDQDVRTIVAANDPPESRIMMFQLDIRSPNQLWLSQIESSLERLFCPLYSVKIPGQPLGSVVGDILMPIRMQLTDSVYIADLEDDVSSRYFRNTRRVRVETWLLPSTQALGSKRGLRFEKPVLEALVSIRDQHDRVQDTLTVIPE